MRVKNWSIMRRLLVSFFTVGAFIALFMAVSIFYVRELGDNLNQCVAEQTYLSQGITALKGALLRSQLNGALFIQTQDREYLEQAEKANLQIERLLIPLTAPENVPWSAKEQLLVGNLDVKWRVYTEIQSSIFYEAENNDSAAIRKKQIELGQTLNEIATDLNQLAQIQTTHRQSTARSGERAQLNAYWAIVSLGALLTLVTLGAGLTISQTITQPIISMAEATKRFGEGDLTQEMNVPGEDEIGGLATMFNRMAGNLRQMVEQIIATSQSLSGAAAELSQSAAGVNDSVEQITANIEQVARGAEVQKEQISTTSQAVAGMATSIQQNAVNAETAGEAAQKAKEMVDNAVQMLNTLEERAAEINRVVSIIDQFADETNILALNASIEAKRAGEYGRGFAAVADEVRGLAERSSRSVNEIAALTENIQTEMNRLIQSMSEVIDAVDRTVRFAGGTATAAQEQQAEASRMVKAIQQMEEITEANAAVADAVSVATADQRSSIVQMINSAQHLANLANQLGSLAEKFKIDVKRET